VVMADVAVSVFVVVVVSVVASVVVAVVEGGETVASSSFLDDKGSLMVLLACLVLSSWPLSPLYSSVVCASDILYRKRLSLKNRHT